MARILFPGPIAGLVILPIMLFHAFQLFACAWIAATAISLDVPLITNNLGNTATATVTMTTVFSSTGVSTYCSPRAWTLGPPTTADSAATIYGRITTLITDAQALDAGLSYHAARNTLLENQARLTKRTTGPSAPTSTVGSPSCHPGRTCCARPAAPGWR